MVTSEVHRQQLILGAMSKSTGDVGNDAAKLWQPLASRLISIIGEGGFNALYTRSLFLVSKEFPWLTPTDVPHSSDLRFTDLKTRLERQETACASQAVRALLVSFTSILASLIGDTLTIDILISAWGDNAPDRDIAGKESK